MFIEILKSKIHRAVVTDANLNYEGSISINDDLLQASGIREHQKVHVVNINNGNRFETYVIQTKNPNEICLNGAAARLVCPGDRIIIMSYYWVDIAEIDELVTTVVRVDESNNIIELREIQNKKD